MCEPKTRLERLHWRIRNTPREVIHPLSQLRDSRVLCALSRSVDWIGGMNPLEAKAGLVWIVAEESAGVSRALLHVIWEFGECPPEPACESRLHSRSGPSSSRCRILPASPDFVNRRDQGYTCFQANETADYPLFSATANRFTMEWVAQYDFRSTPRKWPPWSCCGAGLPGIGAIYIHNHRPSAPEKQDYFLTLSL
jgi:hypothetical protein